MDNRSRKELVQLIKRHVGDPRIGVEVGVYRGETSAKLLDAFPSLHLHVVDPWAVYDAADEYRKSGDGKSKLTAQEQFENYSLATKNCERSGKGRFTVHRSTSLDAAQNGIPKWLADGPGLCFAFIDGDHTAEAVLSDLVAWWPLVGQAGLLCGHDYGHKRYPVKQVVDRWALVMKLQVGVVPGSLWWCRK